MRYSQLKRGLSPDEAAAYVGSKELPRQFERSGWVQPFIRGNRLTRYDLRDLDACIDRLKGGDALPRPAGSCLNLERSHDLAVVGPQLGVVSLHDTHIVAKPGRNPVDVDSLA